MSESMKNKRPIVLVSAILDQQDVFTEESNSTMIAQNISCVCVTVHLRYSDATVGISITSDGLFAISDAMGEQRPAIVNLIDLVRWAKNQCMIDDRRGERVH